MKRVFTTPGGRAALFLLSTLLCALAFWTVSITASQWDNLWTTQRYPESYSADRVLRSFQVENARETALPDVGAEDAVVLYGEVIHMGTYGYAVREEGRYTRIVYANGDSGVITFLLDGEERVSAVRFQMEGQMALPLESQAE